MEGGGKLNDMKSQVSNHDGEILLKNNSVI